MLHILLLISPSLAATLNVSSSGTYTTIQSAINAASSGDTIQVALGTYRECLDTKGKNLTIQGAGSTTKLIGSSCSTGVLRITGGESVTFSDFTVENSSAVAIYIDSSFATFEDIEVNSSGTTATSGSLKYGGGLYATAAYVDISDSTFDGNKSDYGGAIAIDSGTAMTLDNVVFEDNRATYGGGAIRADEVYTVLELDGCTFTDNGTSSSSSGKGGAIMLYDSVEFSDIGSTFEENFAANYGGAIFADDDCEVVLEDSIFDANYVDRTFASPISGGAIYAEDLATFEITGATFTDNVAYLYGGAIHGNSVNDTVLIDRTTFEGNEVESVRGGAIEASAGTDLWVVDSLFDSNLAAEGGAAISLYTLSDTITAEITGTIFEGNETSSTRNAHGAAIFAYNYTGSLDVLIEDSVFEDNTASLSGGAIYGSNVDELIITDSVFEGNTASGTSSATGGYYTGGAISVDNSDEVTVTGSTFCGNTADDGGGVYFYTVSDLVFTNNIVVENTASLGDGGNLYFYDVVGEMVNNNVLGGSAAGDGGGGYFDGGTALDVINTAFAYNGSGVYAADSASASGSAFSYNDWYSNTGYDRSGSFSFSVTSSGNITSAPSFTSYSKDGNCGNDDFVLSSTSALIDAGDTTIKDPDGSRSDIGAYGGPDSPYYDGDGDGSYNRDDCDDDDATVYPGASEVCDGIDNDCDGSVDETPTGGTTYYTDSDGDGYGDTSTGAARCSGGTGYTTVSGDCNDGDALTYPGADEYCDGADDDCDGTVDESSAVDASTFYGDVDGDGYGGTKFTTKACSAPTSYVSNSTDCDDADKSINPGATEYCDGDDNDCDSTVDEDDAADAVTYYYDNDGDGYGVSTFTDKACSAPTGFVVASGDCNDSSSSVNPGATEVCDSIDNDCDGTVDGAAAVGASTFYADGDGDGYGDATRSTRSCSTPTGYVSNSTDCRDGDAADYPGADEYCDGDDNNCDGTVDESSAVDASTFYADGDGDGYGDAAATTVACLAPSGHVADDTDCDDGAPAVNPSAVEVCDTIDNDCDTSVDGPESLDAGTFYFDGDGDGFGDGGIVAVACTQPSDHAVDGTDCDDTLEIVYPGADEYCDGLDNDCDVSVDEDAVDATVWYVDADGDGYGNPEEYDADCEVPGDAARNGEDCDDADPDAYPGREELPYDGIDNDCEGGDLTDVDGDGYDADYVGGLDCDDNDSSIYPGASDDPSDGVDSDCDSTAEEVGDSGDEIDGEGGGGKEGCSHVRPEGAGLWGLVALMGAALGRRRRRAI